VLTVVADKVSPHVRQVLLALVRNNTLERAERADPTSEGRGRRIVNLIDEKKFSELEVKAIQLKDEEAMRQFLYLLREAYDLQHVFFAVLGGKGEAVFTTTCGTYPAEWNEFYSRHGFNLADPVLRRVSGNSPVLWHTMENMSPDEIRLMEKRAEFGIGPHGMTIPQISSDGRTSVLSLTGKTDAGDSWKKRAGVLWREFREIGLIMHAAHLKLSHLQPPRVELSARHVECIRMLGNGMSVPEIAEFQGLKQKSVKIYIKEARTRLRARNNAQLLYNAIQLGFVEMFA
jgi:DNA-binding CsgD family transcriptional regulator